MTDQTNPPTPENTPPQPRVPAPGTADSVPPAPLVPPIPDLPIAYQADAAAGVPPVGPAQPGLAQPGLAQPAAAQSFPGQPGLGQPGPAGTVPPAVAATAPAWVNPPRMGLAAVGGAIGVGGAIAGTLVVIALTVALTLVTGSGSGGIGGANLDGAVFAVLVWLSALGLFGGVSGAIGGGGASGSMLVTFVPVIVFLAGSLAAAWWSFRQERTHRSAGRTEFWVLSGLAGLAAAILTLVLSILGRQQVSVPMVGHAELSSLSVASFFGPLIAIGLASAFGRWLARAENRGFFRALIATPAHFRWGTRDLYDYLVALTLIFVPISLIAVFVIGNGSLVAWPAAVGVLTSATIAVAHFAGYSVGANGSGLMDGSQTITLSSAPNGWIWLLPVFAVVAALLASLAVAQRRRFLPVPIARAWVLPVSTAVAALVFGFTFGLGTFSGTAGIGGVGMGFSMSVAPVAWAFLMAGVWGALVETLARYVAPTLIATAPALGRIAFGPSPAGAPTTAAPAGASAAFGQSTTTYPYAAPDVAAATAAGQVAPGMGGPANVAGVAAPPTPPAEAKPLSPAAKRGLIIGACVAGALIVVGGAGAVAVSILKATVFSPDTAVQSYLADIADGRFASAFEQTPRNSTGGTALVSSNDAQLDATITDVQITDTSVSDTSAVMAISYELDGQRETATISLVSSGTKFLFFDDWRISSGLETYLFVSGSEASIAGIDIDPGQGGTELIAYPGVYPVAGKESRWMTLDAEPVRVGSSGAQLSLDMHPTPALTDEIQKQVNQKIDTCATSTDLEPKGCPFSRYAWGETKDVVWKVVTYPTVELTYDNAFTATDGEMGVTYQSKSMFTDWSAEDDTRSINYWGGEYEIDGDTVAVTFE